MLIWRVVYDCVFSSSSGMDEYSIEHNFETCLVWTSGDALSDVEREIRSVLGNQTKLTRIHSAEFIGKTINAIAGE